MSGREVARRAMLGAVASAFWLAGAGLSARAADQPAASPFDPSSVAAIPEVTVEAPAVVPVPGSGTDLALTTPLKQYAMTNPQLGTVRGGFTTGNGVTFNFGFEQVTTINGTIVQGVMVQNVGSTLVGNAYVLQDPSSPTCSTSACYTSVSKSVSATASHTYSVVNGKVTQGSTLSSSPGWTPNVTLDPSKPITVTSNDNCIGSYCETTIKTQLGQNGIVNSINNVADNQLINQATALSVDVSGLASAVAAEQAVHSIMTSVSGAVGIH
jgi:hypothetical protein